MGFIFRQFLGLVALCLSLGACQKRQHEPPLDQLQNGDILFISSISQRAEIVRKTTHSRCSQVGILYKDENGFFVYTAEEMVRPVPLIEFLENGESRLVVVKRLKNSAKVLTSDRIKIFKEKGMQYSGQSYDYLFSWKDGRMYSAELVWKMYQKGLNVVLCPPRRVQDLDWSSNRVRDSVEPFGLRQVAMQDTLIQPIDILQSHLLETVWFR
jgi:Permuted papain-like amidase enzyme, YaeF/YiiX, C92 family